MEKVKVIEDVWYKHQGDNLTVMVTDCKGHDFSIADIQVPEKCSQEYLYNIAFETAIELGYVLSVYLKKRPPKKDLFLLIHLLARMVDGQFVP